MCLVVLPASAAVFLLSKPVAAYQMGEVYAKSMGIHVGRLRAWMVLLSSLLSACIVAFAGPVSFVGIAVPHLVRSLFRTSRPLVLIPAVLSGRGRVLPVQRSSGQDSSGSGRVQHQHSDRGAGSSGGDRRYDEEIPEEGIKVGNGCFYADRLAAGYGKRSVAEGLSFHAGRGEIVTLIGPNGAGKSTILKTISGGLAPMGGELVLDGVPMERIPRKERARKLAVVFTEKLQGELMTCRDVTAAGRYPYTGRLGLLSEKDQRAVDQALELVHGTDLGDRPFDRISDGQRQRIMLARALCQEPEMILLDEPTSHLDVKYKLEFLSLLREMARKKELSVIMSLHELDLAGRISEPGGVHKGRTHGHRCGTPEQVFTPGYVEGLFGMTAGKFDAAGGSVEFSVPGGAVKPVDLPENAVFVIAGNGSGRQVFRKLQRENVPFDHRDPDLKMI